MVFQPLRGQGEQFGCGLEIPVGRLGPGVTEEGRKDRQAGGNVDTGAIPADQGVDRESVAQVVSAP
ncbi:hypothetical protein GCM10009555_050310 [Acrocarpospora macrocephala]|uniref:Uncharacterized protein n=1 Tax=Acrocarpospora macrocephala TaxID=150177 RepID=A0A5M3X411_9ACTN|nr:hypothetical protein Amac_064450 [Acrocarpospora macrocephala]